MNTEEFILLNILALFTGFLIGQFVKTMIENEMDEKST